VPVFALFAKAGVAQVGDVTGIGTKDSRHHTLFHLQCTCIHSNLVINVTFRLPYCLNLDVFYCA